MALHLKVRPHALQPQAVLVAAGSRKDGYMNESTKQMTQTTAVCFMFPTHSHCRFLVTNDHNFSLTVITFCAYT